MQPLRMAWLGGEHDFALRIGELRSLQGARDAGPEQIYNRIRLGNWHPDDLLQVIRWGLVGGGMDASEAATTVTSLFDLHPQMSFKLAALKIMHHSLFGPEDDPAGEA